MHVTCISHTEDIKQIFQNNMYGIISFLLKKKMFSLTHTETYTDLCVEDCLKALTVITPRELERRVGIFAFYFIFCGCFYNKHVCTIFVT